MSNIEAIMENANRLKKKHYKDGKANKVQTHVSPKIQYKGITLKQYFRLCDESNQIKQIQEESVRSSEQSKAQTPAFGCNENQPQNEFRKMKMKTEVQQHDQININRHYQSKKKNKNVFYPMVGQKLSNTMEQKNPFPQSFESNDNRRKKQIVQKKRVVSIPSESSKELLNQSTLTSFYQLEKKKKKMLNKVKVEKQRANQMRLSDAFFITKYGSKFKLDQKSFK